MEIILKTAAAAAAALVLCGFIREQLPEMSVIMSFCAVVAVFVIAAPLLSQAAELLSSLFSNELADYIKPVIKVLGITTVSKLLCDMCRDSGEKALATALELITAAASAAVILPVFLKAVEKLGSGI